MSIQFDDGKALYDPDGTFKDQIAEIIKKATELEWFDQLSDLSKRGLKTNISNFHEFLDHTKVTNESKLDILNLFQEHRVNNKKTKSGSTGVGMIKNLINQLLKFNDDLDKNTRTLCKLILQRHRPLPNHEPKQTSISSWFLEIPWLKFAFPPEEYSQLAKPRILIESFIFTISTILFEITSQKKKLLNTINNINKKLKYEEYKNRDEMRTKRKLFLRLIFKELINRPEYNDPGLRELFLIDCINEESCRNQVQQILEDDSKSSAEKRKLVALINRLHFNRPNILAPKKNDKSIFEENLFTFICAWLAIQPSDILKLKRKNFIIGYDENNNPTLVKCEYFKGRTGAKHESPIVTADSIIGKAILSYLDSFELNDRLVSFRASYTNNLTFGGNSTSKLLALCFERKFLNEKIKTQLRINSTTEVFLNAYLFLYRNHDSTFTNWNNLRKRQRLKHNSFELYKENVEKWLPSTLFYLSNIKNSSIHAKSDKFRINDPINSNSHTSKTEYENYLTDSNKEWMNLNGAINRLVMKKVEGAFILNTLQQETLVHNKLIHTKFEEDFINNFNQVDLKPSINNSAHQILNKLIVLDTTETVLFMRHYIAQVISKANTLVRCNLEFFELTALPTAEWMETILATKITPKVVLEGDRRYEALKQLLPELFTNEIRSGDIN